MNFRSASGLFTGRPKNFRPSEKHLAPLFYLKVMIMPEIAISPEFIWEHSQGTEVVRGRRRSLGPEEETQTPGPGPPACPMPSSNATGN